MAVGNFHGCTLRPDQQDSQKGLQAAVRVCHPRGYLRGCLLEDHTGGLKITPAAFGLNPSGQRVPAS
jgi:hypothetical protein